MNQDKCNAIEAYLRNEFPNSNIEHADISDNQHYRIPTENGLLMLKVGREFMEDNSEEKIIEKLTSLNVPDLLRENRDLGIVVADSGATTYQRN